MLSCLELFRNASGQKINSQKTSIMFSKNVEEQLRDALILRCGFTRVEELGRYLGLNIRYGRKCRGNYQFLVDKIQKRLSSWKAPQNLSLAGRLKFVQAVTQQIPVYNMLHERVPDGVCKEIERMQKNFIWGSVEGRKKYHAISWEGLCRPKCVGSFGLRNMRRMNKALICKVGLEVISKPEKLCSQVLKGKYGEKG